MSPLVLHANAWTGYLICHLFPDADVLAWHAALDGSEVERRARSAAADGPGRPALLFHIDLSDTRRTPGDRIGLLERLRNDGFVVLNGGCDDLSRRRLQARLDALGLNTVAVRRDTPGDTVVIVKTDPNHGGVAELRLSAVDRDHLGISFRGDWLAPSGDYRLMPLDAVPDAVRRHDDYAVERYVRNTAGMFYRAYVSGTALVVVKAHCPLDLKRIVGDERDENWAFHLDHVATNDDCAEAGRMAALIGAYARATDLAFGSIDVAVDDTGALHIIDVNMTPWGGRAEIDPEIVGVLRDGFVEGVERRRAASGRARAER